MIDELIVSDCVLNVNFVTYVTVFTVNILLVYTWLSHGMIDVGQLRAFVTKYVTDMQGML